MVNAKEYKPLINELIDLLNQQKKLAGELAQKIEATENDEKFSAALQNYLKSMDAQSEALETVARMTQISFENDEFNKIIHK